MKGRTLINFEDETSISTSSNPVKNGVLARRPSKSISLNNDTSIFRCRRGSMENADCRFRCLRTGVMLSM